MYSRLHSLYSYNITCRSNKLFVIYSIENTLSVISGWKGPSMVDWHWVFSWCFQGIVFHQGLSISPCCWQVGHSEVERLVLVIGSLYSWASIWASGETGTWAHQDSLRLSMTKDASCQLGKSICLLACSVPLPRWILSAQCLLWFKNLHVSYPLPAIHTQASTPDLLFWIFQSFPFRLLIKWPRYWVLLTYSIFIYIKYKIYAEYNI